MAKKRPIAPALHCFWHKSVWHPLTRSCKQVCRRTNKLTNKQTNKQTHRHVRVHVLVHSHIEIHLRILTCMHIRARTDRPEIAGVKDGNLRRFGASGAVLGYVVLGLLPSRGTADMFAKRGDPTCNSQRWVWVGGCACVCIGA